MPRSRSLPSSSRLVPTLATLVVSAGLLADARPAQAAALTEPAGEKGTLAIDQISGFRASMADGISYAGPLGFTHSALTTHSLGANTDTTTNRNTLWLTPSADIFVINHLSVGGLIELTTTWSSVDVPRNNNTTQTVTLPGTTSITFLPRVGYLFPITDRFAVWPRAGIGYARHETVSGADNPDTAVKDTFSSLVFDLDVGLVYRINETFFVRGDPDLVFTVGGSHSQSTNAGSTSANASFVQFSAAFGVGVFLDVF